MSTSNLKRKADDEKDNSSSWDKKLKNASTTTTMQDEHRWSLLHRRILSPTGLVTIAHRSHSSFLLRSSSTLPLSTTSPLTSNKEHMYIESTKKRIVVTKQEEHTWSLLNRRILSPPGLLTFAYRSHSSLLLRSSSRLPLPTSPPKRNPFLQTQEIKKQIRERDRALQQEERKEKIRIQERERERRERELIIRVDQERNKIGIPRKKEREEILRVDQERNKIRIQKKKKEKKDYV